MFVPLFRVERIFLDEVVSYWSIGAYTPMDAPLPALEAMLARLGLERVVLIQTSVFGTDNSCMLDAIARTAWRLRVTLDSADTGAGTALVFTQPISGVEQMAPDVGPGWEYYLDRLVAAETGGDPDAVDFARDYHPAMSGHYRPLAEQLRARD